MARFSMRPLMGCLAMGLLAGCADDVAEIDAVRSSTDMSETAELAADNPFSVPSTLDLGYPRFDLIEDAHFMPAFEAGMREQLAEIAAIVADAAAPTVDNTLVPLEASGQLLQRVSSVFFALTGAHTSDAIKAIQAEMAPRLAAHRDEILLDSGLFDRIRAIHAQRVSAELDPETLRLVGQTYKDFVRAGAELAESDKARLRAINAELAELQTRFQQNVLNEGNALAIIVDDVSALAGLTPSQIQTAAGAAANRGLDGQYVIPLLNTTQQPAMSALEDRALRERMLEDSMSRGSRGDDYDNRGIVSRIATLRAERAQLLGYATHADYVLADETAGSVDVVNQRLAELMAPAAANARREAADLQAIVDAEDGGFRLEAWDWDFYAEKLRLERYAFDDAELKPYFELDRVLRDGVFYAAAQLYGLRFVERHDLPVYEDSVRVFEVVDSDGSTLAIFMLDAYARPTKRGGAWASRYVTQSRLLGTQTVVANHSNIAKPPEGEPTLLTFTEVNTLFHEFGHALHGMFSDVMYPSLAATNVPRDFVEFPSQVNEMWATWPEVLRNYARHYETDEPLPSDLIERVLEAETFNQGYATTEYLAASMIDQALHQLAPEDVPSADTLMSFESDVLQAAGAPLDIVPPRYRYPYFLHPFSYAYSAAYYAYIWSEVLDADSVDWFEENGGMTRANGQRFRDTLLSRGGSDDPMALYRNFRGRDAEVRPLLERRGLL